MNGIGPREPWLTDVGDVCEFFVHALQSCTELKSLILSDGGFVNADFAAVLDALADGRLSVHFINEPVMYLLSDDGSTCSKRLGGKDEEESDDGLV